MAGPWLGRSSQRSTRAILRQWKPRVHCRRCCLGQCRPNCSDGLVVHAWQHRQLSQQRLPSRETCSAAAFTAVGFLAAAFSAAALQAAAFSAAASPPDAFPAAAFSAAVLLTVPCLLARVPTCTVEAAAFSAAAFAPLLRSRRDRSLVKQHMSILYNFFQFAVFQNLSFGQHQNITEIVILLLCSYAVLWF